MVGSDLASVDLATIKYGEIIPPAGEAKPDDDWPL